MQRRMEGQDVHPEDIHYYDEPPFDDGNHLAHGVDLAISTKESADYTAIVSGEVTWPGGNLEIYILPHPILRRMTFSETMETLDNVRRSSNMSSGSSPYLFDWPRSERDKSGDVLRPFHEYGRCTKR
jgi:hypothetical protein